MEAEVKWMVFDVSLNGHHNHHYALNGTGNGVRAGWQAGEPQDTNVSPLYNNFLVHFFFLHTFTSVQSVTPLRCMHHSAKAMRSDCGERMNKQGLVCIGPSAILTISQY